MVSCIIVIVVAFENIDAKPLLKQGGIVCLRASHRTDMFHTVAR